MVDDNDANKSISKTGKSADGLGKKLGNGIKTAGKWALGVGVAAAAIGVATFAMVKKVTGGFDDIAKNSRKMGVTTDYYQEMDYWASQNGLSHENMEKSMKRLNQRLGQAAEGNEKYSNALTRLGVDMEGVKDGTVSTEDAMTQSIQTLSQMENGQEKAALASELFGTKLAQEMMPALDAGALSIEEAKQKAEELGIVIGEDSLLAAEEFNDTWDDLTRTFQAVGQKVLAELMPIFQAMMDWVIANMPMIQEVFSSVMEVVSLVFSTLVDWISTTITWFGEFFESNNSTFTGIWETISDVMTTIWQFLLDTWTLISEMWDEYGSGIMETAFTIFKSIWDIVKIAFDAVWDIIKTIMDMVVPFIKETLATLAEFWSENGAQIMTVVKGAFNFIKGVIDFVMPVIVAIIKGAWSIIQTIISTTVGVIMGLVKTFSSLLTGDFNGIKEGVTRIWQALWNGIKGIVSGAWGLLSGAFTALFGSIKKWFGSLKDSAIDWGRNMISGFIDGIKQMAGKVKDAAKGVVDSVAGFLKFWSPAKEGEGRFITHWGRNMVDGFLDGVEDETDEAGKVMNNLIESMSPDSLDFNASVNGRGLINSSKNGVTTTLNKNSGVEGLLVDLINAVREGQNIIVDGNLLGATSDKYLVNSANMESYMRGER